jgi:hypothetical protein
VCVGVALAFTSLPDRPVRPPRSGKRARVIELPLPRMLPHAAMHEGVRCSPPGLPPEARTCGRRTHTSSTRRRPDDASCTYYSSRTTRPASIAARGWHGRPKVRVRAPDEYRQLQAVDVDHPSGDQAGLLVKGQR